MDLFDPLGEASEAQRSLSSVLGMAGSGPDDLTLEPVSAAVEDKDLAVSPQAATALQASNLQPTVRACP